MIPEGWALESLEDVAQVRAGLAKGKRTSAKQVTRPYLRVANVQDGYLDLSVIKEILVPENEIVRYSLAEGDVLLTEGGDFDKLGRGAVWRGQISDCLHQNHVFAVRVDRTRLEPEYFSALSSSHYGKSYYLSCAKRSTNLASINSTQLKQFPVLFPPLPEQQRIAAVLNAWDDAITACEKLVTSKEQRLDWVRAHVLTGKVRLPGYAKPWQSGQIANVLTEHGLTSTGREEVHSVSVHQGLINQIEHLGRSFAAANTGHYNRVLPGDIVYTKSPTGDFPLGIIKQSRLDKAAIVSPLYGVFTPVSRELGTIMDTLFASPAAAERLLAPVVQKGAKNTIAVTNKNFLKAQLSLPTDQREIVALSELVEAARAELDVHQAELKLLRNQKRGLMQKLLTGQWRVPESIHALLPGPWEVAA